MMRYLKLIGLFARVNVQNEAAYRFDFFMRIALAAMQIVGEILMLWVIFSNTNSLAGWSTWQVVVLLGVFRVMIGFVGALVAPNMRALMEDIRNGTLDFVLTKPIDSQFYVSFRQLVIWRGVDIALGLALTAVGAVNLAVSMSAGKIALFILMLSAGAIIVYSLWLAIATTVFWFTRINNIEMVFWNVFEAGRYPIDIYPSWIRWFLTFVMPMAFLITIPAGTLVDKTSGGSLVTALLAAAGSLAAASAFWRYGLRHYSGASA